MSDIITKQEKKQYQQRDYEVDTNGTNITLALGVDTIKKLQKLSLEADCGVSGIVDVLCNNELTKTEVDDVVTIEDVESYVH